jgi:hypothetical protein
MIRTVKTTLGLSLLALLAFGGISALSASATTSGHFVSGSTTTELDLKAATGSTHEGSLSAFGATVSCHQASYTADVVAASTVTSVTVSPSPSGCTTGSSGVATVRMNGCNYSVTSRSTGHATVHLVCPTGKKAEIEMSAGLMKFGPQTPTSGGLTYTNLHDGTITVSVTAEGLHAECHGACQLLGTNTTTAKITGSLTVEGTDTVTGVKTAIQAT